MDNMKHRRLQELDRSDFDIVKGEPDIRGWDVRNNAGQKIGEVEELIIDAQQKKVRYMVVELDDDDLDLEDDRKVLIPIGLAQLHKDDDDVLLPAVTVDQLKALPAYDSNNLDEEAERRICTILGRQQATTGTTTQTHIQQATSASSDTGGNSNASTTQDDSDFYRHDYFQDDNLYKNRLHEASSAPKTEESDYERGLRLWELRSEGGLLPSENSESPQRRPNLSHDERMEMVRNRRKSYEDRRGSRKDNTIIQRIKDEGLQEGR